MPHSRERGNPKCTHTPKQVSRILLPALGWPSGAPSCLCYEGQARISSTREAPSRPREEGSASRPSASQLQLPLSHRSLRTPLTSDDNARQRPQRQQSGPELSRPPCSHPVRCPSRRAHATASLVPTAAFPAAGGEGKGGEGTGWVGHSGAGRALALPPSGPAWTLPEAECDWETSEPSPALHPQGPACVP